MLSGSPNTNYGSGNQLSADGSPQESTLLFWDLTSIPVGSNIQSAVITLNVTGKSSDEYEFYPMQRTWIESEATWDEYAIGQSWEISGADGTADRSSMVMGSITAPATGNYTISLNTAGVAVVQSWVDDPSSNYGIIIMDYINASDGLDINSRETGIIANR
ncbi:MAG: DNRLRE domain-containing protein, partial [Promethearchaeota archaeon]